MKKTQFLSKEESVDLLTLAKRDKASALTYACQHGNVEMIRCLVEAVKSRHGNEELLKLASTKDGKSSKTPFHYAVGSGKEEAVKELLELPGISMAIRKRDDLGNSALHMACESKVKLEIFKLLLEKSELLMKNHENETAVAKCAKNNQVEKLECILQAVRSKNGEEALAKVLNQPRKDGQTPLSLAAATDVKAVKVCFFFVPCLPFSNITKTIDPRKV